MVESRRLNRRAFLTAGAAGLALGRLPASPQLGADRTRLKEAGPMLPPVPAVLLSIRGVAGAPDELGVVWTFVVNGSPPQVGVSVGDEHVVQQLIDRHGEFVLNVPVAELVEAFDRVDMSSLETGDKYELSGLTRGTAVVVDAPTVEECPIHVECRVFDSIVVPPVRKIFLADVVATTVLDGTVDDSERLQVPAVRFFGMTAGSGEFYTMGDRVGNIGQTVGRNDIRY